MIRRAPRHFKSGPYRFFNREYIIIKYRTTMEALRAVVPEPLQIAEPVVLQEWIRMPDSTGLYVFVVF